MKTAEQLLTGYTAYTNAEEFGAGVSADAPAITPTVLSFIGGSSGGCGAAVSVISGAGVSVTANWG
ncbi:LxmA leader domain family RiPP [Streptomyces sp. V1I6]|uniref:LxmA leader domain family RiPP n=1 Tax=Streptomyces sp. V1I6 TaxID=3042273 RepID=UPI002786E2EF|nr:LxmA leader domain family RiPP [Streptomyces sp. V1I6]MDQ0843932.1 Asp-tRNA(Asn)/Glu-tRNA(Gln) amidotransferase A subunit family amidase [Streptomyces sp. V1I6]